MEKIVFTIDEYMELLHALRFKRKHKRNQIKNWQKNKDARIEQRGQERYYSQLNGKIVTLAKLDNVIAQVVKLIKDFNK